MATNGSEEVPQGYFDIAVHSTEDAEDEERAETVIEDIRASTVIKQALGGRECKIDHITEVTDDSSILAKLDNAGSVACIIISLVTERHFRGRENEDHFQFINLLTQRLQEEGRDKIIFLPLSMVSRADKRKLPSYISCLHCHVYDEGKRYLKKIAYELTKKNAVYRRDNLIRKMRAEEHAQRIDKAVKDLGDHVERYKKETQYKKRMNEIQNEMFEMEQEHERQSSSAPGESRSVEHGLFPPDVMGHRTRNRDEMSASPGFQRVYEGTRTLQHSATGENRQRSVPELWAQGHCQQHDTPQPFYNAPGTPNSREAPFICNLNENISPSGTHQTGRGISSSEGSRQASEMMAQTLAKCPDSDPQIAGANLIELQESSDPQPMDIQQQMADLQLTEQRYQPTATQAGMIQQGHEHMEHLCPVNQNGQHQILHEQLQQNNPPQNRLHVDAPMPSHASSNYSTMDSSLPTLRHLPSGASGCMATSNPRQPEIDDHSSFPQHQPNIAGVSPQKQGNLVAQDVNNSSENSSHSSTTKFPVQCTEEAVVAHEPSQDSMHDQTTIHSEPGNEIITQTSTSLHSETFRGHEIK